MAAGQGERSGAYRSGQPAFRRGRLVGRPYGHAAPLRALEQRLSALRPLGAARCLAEGFAQLAQDADFEAVFMDSTIVGAHQHAAGAPKKRVTKPSDEAGAD